MTALIGHEMSIENGTGELRGGFENWNAQCSCNWQANGCTSREQAGHMAYIHLERVERSLTLRRPRRSWAYGS